MSASWPSTTSWMSAAWRYAVTGALLVGVAVLALWPWMDEAGRRGLLAAGVTALPIQVAAFAALVRFRGRTRSFLAVWAGGTVARMAVVLTVGWMVLQAGGDGAVVMPLALAAFFFALLLLEPVYFRFRAVGGEARRP